MDMDRRQALVAGAGAAALVAGGVAASAEEPRTEATLAEVRSEIEKADVAEPLNLLDSPMFKSNVSHITKKSGGVTLYVGLPNLSGEDFKSVADAEDSILRQLHRAPPMRIQLSLNGLSVREKAAVLSQVRRDIETNAYAAFKKMIKREPAVTGTPTFIAEFDLGTRDRVPIFLMNTADDAEFCPRREPSILQKRLGRWEYPKLLGLRGRVDYLTGTSDAVPRGEFIVYGLSKDTPLETGIVSLRPDGRVRLHQDCQEQPTWKNGLILPFSIETDVGA